MRKQIVPGIILLIISAVIAAGSQTFLSSCVHDDGTFGSCRQAERALLGLGCVSGVLAVLSLSVKKARFGAYLSALPVCVMGVLTPGALLDLCRMSTMRCRMVMQPAMMILFSVAFLCAACGAILSAGK